MRPAPPRYRNEIGKYSIRRDSTLRRLRPLRRVVSRGRASPAGGLPAGHPPVGLPLHRAGLREDRPLLRGRLPATGAFACRRIPCFETLGDYRWTPDLIVSTWQMAETGRAPRPYLESEVGDSGGGFDRLRFRIPATPPAGPAARRNLHRAGPQSPQRLRGRRSPSTCPGTAAACRSARPTSACCWARPGWPRPSTASPAPARAAIPSG